MSLVWNIQPSFLKYPLPVLVERILIQHSASQEGSSPSDWRNLPLNTILDIRAAQQLPLKPKANIYPIVQQAPEVSGPCTITSEAQLISFFQSNDSQCEKTYLLAGKYQLTGSKWRIASRNSHPKRLIGVGKVLVQLDTEEGFLIDQPGVSFSNLKIEGRCVQHSCEHAFHIVGAATHTKIHNNVISNFNAAIKINGVNEQWPDFGEVTNNVIFNDAPRQTNRPVTPINLVGASHWKIRHNTVFDFHKVRGNRISYGIFVKGGGQQSDISANFVACNAANHSFGQQIAISAGGGGTGVQFKRNTSATEYSDLLIHHNLIANCNTDVSIYINRSNNITIANNLHISSLGISARFAQSQAIISHNLIPDHFITEQGAQIALQENQLMPLGFWTMPPSLLEGLSKQGQLKLDTKNILTPSKLLSYPRGSVDFCGKPTQSADYVGLSQESICPDRITNFFHLQ